MTNPSKKTHKINMKDTTYEPIMPEDNTPATKGDVAQILMAIEMLSEQISNNLKQ